MLQLLNERIENGFVIREYTRDGNTVSHTIKTPVETQREEEVIALPKDPLVELREQNELLKQELLRTNNDLQTLMEFVAGGGQ